MNKKCNSKEIVHIADISTTSKKVGKSLKLECVLSFKGWQSTHPSHLQGGTKHAPQQTLFLERETCGTR